MNNKRIWLACNQFRFLFILSFATIFLTPNSSNSSSLGVSLLVLSRSNYIPAFLPVNFSKKFKQAITKAMNEAWPDIKMKYTYINSNLDPLIKFRISSRNTQIKIFPYETSLKWSQSLSQQHKNCAINCTMKKRILLLVWRKLNRNWNNNMIEIFQWMEGHWRQ